MKNSKRRRFAFRPLAIESRLEERLVLDGGTVNGNAVILVLTPPTNLAPPGVTPAPAAPPISPRVAARALARAARPLAVSQIHAAYRRQVRAATRDLRAAIQAQVGQLSANGATPTPQQIADFNASIAGALDATTLRLSTQAALLPHAGVRLVPAIQNALLGSGPRSLVNRLNVLVQSGQLSGTTGASASALTRLLNTTNQQAVSRINTFFNTTPLARLSVNSTGQRIPLEQFMGNQLLNQVANTFGLLSQTFPIVANSILFPNGTNVTPTQAAVNQFNTEVGNALATAAFQLGSGLSVFPGSSGVITQLQPLLFSTTNSPVNSGASSAATGINTAGGTFNTGAGSAATGIGNSASSAATGIADNTFNSLVAALQNLPFGSTGFNTAVSNAFGTAFQNMVTPLGQFFQMTGQPNLTLPTNQFISPFGSAFTGNTFFNGFNNGFATGTTPGFIGFGTAPTRFNTNFGTGFNNMVSNFNSSVGFLPGSTGLLPGGIILGPGGGLQGGLILM
jgi:hypothetical protein